MDIVERLRPPMTARHDALCNEAAYEIERLRAERELLRLAVRDDAKWAQELETIRAERDALRAALVELVACRDLFDRYTSISPIEPGCEREVMREERKRREPVAWQAARAAVKDKPC